MSWAGGVNELAKIKLSDRKAMDLMQNFFPISEDLSDIQRKNNLRMLDDLKRRYFDAPDLLDMGKNGYRFVNAVSDFATHAEPIRKTKNYNEKPLSPHRRGQPHDRQGLQDGAGSISHEAANQHRRDA